jgi:drug/metabolite transporter (DMT)-like permease
MTRSQLHRGLCIDRLAAFTLERDRHFVRRGADPLVTVVTASFLTNETPTLTFLAGSLLVLLGIYVGA